MLAIPIIMLLYYDNGPLLSFHSSFIQKKKTLFHMFIVTQYENTFTTVTLSISILS